MRGQLLTNPSPDEAREWREARGRAEAEGTFFMAWPHLSAVGTNGALSAPRDLHIAATIVE